MQKRVKRQLALESIYPNDVYEFGTNFALIVGTILAPKAEVLAWHWVLEASPAPNSIPKVIWTLLGTGQDPTWDHSGTHLGSFWDHLGTLGAHLGTFWDNLETF